jgi:Fur family transcriptional regulator, ferric uptake regulator
MMPHQTSSHVHPAEGTTPIVERFRRLGLRVTPQRVLVMEALAGTGGHLAADEIMRWVGEHSPAVNLATVYRTLDTLSAAGLVTQTDLGGGATSYELAGEARHHHLVCRHCGGVAEMDDAFLAPLRERLLADLGFRVETTHLALFGLCPPCRVAEEAEISTRSSQGAGRAEAEVEPQRTQRTQRTQRAVEDNRTGGGS